MENTNYPPRTIAMITLNVGGSERFAMRVDTSSGPGWRAITDSTAGSTFHPDHFVESARPLVVLDRNSDEQMGNLIDSLVANGYSMGTRASVRNALAELLPKVKPDEPTGLGAVVEDNRGELWVRTPHVTGDPGDVNVWMDTHGEFSQWSEVSAVTIMHPGWTG
jgi:hypothetical protein